MLDRLVAVGVLPHARNLHLRHLMNLVAIPSRLNRRRLRPDGIKFGNESFVGSEEVDKALHIMKYRPDVVPGIAFGVRTSPHERVEGVALEGIVPMAFLVAGTEEVRGGVPQVTVVIEVAQEDLFVEFVATLPCEVVSTPVVVGILKRL